MHYNYRDTTKHSQQLGGLSRAHTSPQTLTLTYQNLITSSHVAKGMTDEVWGQSGETITSHHLRWGGN